jgi:hypothetical protein
MYPVFIIQLPITKSHAEITNFSIWIRFAYGLIDVRRAIGDMALSLIHWQKSIITKVAANLH